MLKIRLPDGSARQFEHPPSILEVAVAVGHGLARAALAGRVDGKLVDTSFRIGRDAELAIITERDKDGVKILRHSTAHLLAYAVKELFPDVQVTIGPVIENGFYTISPTNARSRRKILPPSKNAWPNWRKRICP